ncbi:MAG: SDR family NAD(P)-dependent oxidoreductase, partial [bacterium]|nr:SDR family NAD(P)-dependent oxidoreductase [bacterium]
MKFDWKNEVVFITGASSGLGRALALQAGELGAAVILAGRDEKCLEQTAEEVGTKGGTPHIFVFDLAEVYEIPALYKQFMEKMDKPVTILINNAGYNAAGFVQNTPLEVYERNYRVNTLAPVALIQCVMPGMIKQAKGGIANVLSTAMYHSFPGISSYYSSKFALRAIHESLKTEVAGTGIQTLYVEPCGFRSNYWKNIDFGERWKKFRHPENKNAMDPAGIALKVFEAFDKGKEEIVLGGFKDKIGRHLNYW